MAPILPVVLLLVLGALGLAGLGFDCSAQSNDSMRDETNDTSTAEPRPDASAPGSGAMAPNLGPTAPNLGPMEPNLGPVEPDPAPDSPGCHGPFRIVDAEGRPVAARVAVAPIQSQTTGGPIQVGEAHALERVADDAAGGQRAVEGIEPGSLVRVYVAARGYESRRFYRTYRPAACDAGQCACETLALARPGELREELPDVIVDARASRDYYVTTDDCSEIPGSSVCLRASVATTNVGRGDLSLSASIDAMDEATQLIDMSDGSTQTVDAQTRFVYHPAHGHVHVDDWVELRLRRIAPECETDAEGCVVATRGQKVSFCLADTVVFDPALVDRAQPGFRCEADKQSRRIEHGISSGRSDLYTADLPGQLVDLTGLASGDYWLEIEVNPKHAIVEESYDNNVERLRVTLDLPACGESGAEPGEPCDGDDLHGQTCESMRKGFSGGSLACTPACTLDRSACDGPSCPETNLNGAVGRAVASGSTVGRPNLWDPIDCGSVASGSEVTFGWMAPMRGTYVFDTDGSDYDTLLYALKGGCAGPEIECNDDADAADQSPGSSRLALFLEQDQSIVVVVDGLGGEGNYVLNVAIGGRCGDGIGDEGEACDAGDLRGLDCRGVGFQRGTLRCTSDCRLDISACEASACGDGVAELLPGPLPIGEQCDGGDLQGRSCGDMPGFARGMLACTPDCRYDTSACMP